MDAEHLAAAAEVPETAPPPPARDYLAASRSNDRARLDAVRHRDRNALKALVLRRCLLGIDGADDQGDA